MAEEQAAGAAQDDQVQQQFTMQRMYTKDISFESPATPDIFRQNWQPSVNVDLNTVLQRPMTTATMKWSFRSL